VLADVTLSGIPCDWSPDGRSILVTSKWRADRRHSRWKASPIEGDGPDGYSQGALWSPDGSHILFSMTLEADDFDVYTVATDGSDLNRIIDSDLLEEAANWLA
jgi:Tol biopolymer transport system component